MSATRSTLTQAQVIRHSRSLPSFPAVVLKILATLDDPDSNFNVLVSAISRDPVISARVLSVVNMASVRGRREAQVCDIGAAVSLIGMQRVHHIALISSLGTFAADAAHIKIPASFWQHGIAVGVCAEELAQHTGSSISPAIALIAGLLHDIGQLCLFHINAVAHRACWREASARAAGIETLECEYFGVNHSTVGAWLAQHWSLPSEVVTAIGAHHNPDADLATPLVAVVHVAEVLSNALDLTSRTENHVTTLSSAACSQLGLVWDNDVRSLFGRIEARANHANAFFASAAK